MDPPPKARALCKCGRSLASSFLLGGHMHSTCIKLLTKCRYAVTPHLKCNIQRRGNDTRSCMLTLKHRLTKLTRRRTIHVFTRLTLKERFKFALLQTNYRPLNPLKACCSNGLWPPRSEPGRSVWRRVAPRKIERFLAHLCSVTAAIFHFLPRFHPTRNPSNVRTLKRMQHTLGSDRMASPVGKSQS